MAEPPYTTLHARLRAETRGLHDDLERAVDIGGEIATRERYVAYLGRLLAIHRALEAELTRFDGGSEGGLDLGSDRRSSLLVADLAALGAPTGPEGSVRAAPRLGSRATALGARYVLDGSALGARAMLPEIERRLGLTATHGASYFGGFGAAGKVSWSALIGALNAFPPSSVEADAALAGATAAFHLFHQYLPVRASA